jgi:hypothetical protein
MVIFSATAALSLSRRSARPTIEFAKRSGVEGHWHRLTTATSIVEVDHGAGGGRIVRTVKPRVLSVTQSRDLGTNVVRDSSSRV